MDNNTFSIFDEENLPNEKIYSNYDDISYENDVDSDNEEDTTNNIEETYICIECDYRWEYNNISETEENNGRDNYCPMCGSTNALQIQ